MKVNLTREQVSFGVLRRLPENCVVPAIPTNHHTRTIPRSSEIVGFAPLKGPHVCLSRSERWRDHHDWDRDGCCIFCEARRK